jgi:hypothetical protein
VTTTTPVAGWYPDPLGATEHRYWDGSAWTEQTAPAVAVAPAAPEPTQPALTQPAQTQPVPARPMSFQPMPFQAVAPQPQPGWADGPPTAPQPYAYRSGAIPAQHRPQGFAYRRPPGLSIWVKVLIGLGIALVALIIVGILAAIAIPVFLNERAKTHPGSGSAGTQSATTVVVPENAAGLTRSHSASSQQLVQRWLALPLPGTKSVGVYDDASGARRAAILVTRVDMGPVAQQEFLEGAKTGASGAGLRSFHEVSPGTLGGRVQCGVVSAANATICFFADGAVGGVIDVFGTTKGDTLAVGLRQAVERRS